MPQLSVYYIRASLIYLALGFTFGALMLWNKGLPLHPAIWRLLPAHIEFLLLGWTVHLALGVAFWILPRMQDSRGNTGPAWMALWLLNGGILLTGVGPILNASAAVLTLGRIVEAGAAVMFAIHAWPRVKPFGG